MTPLSTAAQPGSGRARSLTTHINFSHQGEEVALADGKQQGQDSGQLGFPGFQVGGLEAGGGLRRPLLRCSAQPNSWSQERGPVHHAGHIPANPAQW